MKTKTHTMAQTGMFAALIVLCTWIAIPTEPPFTMQTFAVLTAALCMGARRGTAAVAVYLALGAVGLPVFSNFTGGIGQLAGITGGYALGFLPTAWIAGRFARKRGILRTLGCVLGVLSCYAAGTVWYVLIYSGGTVGIGAALTTCVLPFLLPDAAKIALALAVSRPLQKYIFYKD